MRTSGVGGSSDSVSSLSSLSISDQLEVSIISVDQSEASSPVHHEVFVVQAPPAMFRQSSATLHSITFHLDFLQGIIKRPSDQSRMSIISVDQSEAKICTLQQPRDLGQSYV